jgi:hypothetical protein
VSATADHPRRPLVICGTRAAIDAAQQLLPPGRVLENVVGDAIARGHLHGAGRVGESTPVYLRDLGVVVIARRVLAKSGRKAWQPISLRPIDEPKEER